MIVNNWFVVVGYIAAIEGRPTFVRCFFIAFWIITVLILMNLIVAMVLEVHDSLEDKVDAYHHEIEVRNKIHKELRDDSIEVMKAKLREASKMIAQLERDLEKEERKLGCWWLLVEESCLFVPC